MNREHVARAALRAYPWPVRAVRGEEMVGTLIDTSAGSAMRFAREILDLVRLGLRARAAQTATVGARRLIADGFCLAGVFFMTQDLATALSDRRVAHALYSSASIALLAAILGIALTGRDRLAGVGALVWTALRMPGLIAAHLTVTDYAGMALPVVSFTVMLVAPRVRVRVSWIADSGSLRRTAVLAATVAILVVLAILAIFARPAGPLLLCLAVLLLAPIRPSFLVRASNRRAMLWLVPILAAVVVLGGLKLLVLAAAAAFVGFAALVLLTDPRLAIAVAVTLTNVGISKASGTRPLMVALFIAATPGVLAAAVARNRRLQRDAHN